MTKKKNWLDWLTGIEAMGDAGLLSTGELTVVDGFLFETPSNSLILGPPPLAETGELGVEGVKGEEVPFGVAGDAGLDAVVGGIEKEGSFSRGEHNP